MFAFPVLLSTGGSRIDWVRALHELIRIIPFFFLFLVNNFLLFELLKEKKHIRYLALAIASIVFFSLAGVFHNQVYEMLGIPQEQGMPPRVDTMWLLNVFFYNLIFSLMGVGFNNAIKITIGWLHNRSNYEQLQKENLKTQLSLLQHQISPHFFMNTLNNIHALIDYDNEVAKNSVVKLSRMMRVLLYENEDYTLQKEVDFIKSYIELIKIRVNQNVEIRLDYPINIPQISFPPLLLISFVENSFKHGIKALGNSFIHISFAVEFNFLLVKIVNSKAGKSQDAISVNKIGIDNTRKRLDLIYGDHYKCDITETDDTFEVNLKIPL